MAKVRKKNRILTVSESAVASYLKEGYDQVDESGKIVSRATGGKTVSLTEYNKALDKIEKLEANQDDSALEALKKENASLKGQITKMENAAKAEDAADKKEEPKKDKK